MLGLEILNLSVNDVHLNDHSLVSFYLYFSPEPNPQSRIITDDTADNDLYV